MLIKGLFCVRSCVTHFTSGYFFPSSDDPYETGTVNPIFQLCCAYNCHLMSVSPTRLWALWKKGLWLSCTFQYPQHLMQSLINTTWLAWKSLFSHHYPYLQEKCLCILVTVLNSSFLYSCCPLGTIFGDPWSTLLWVFWVTRIHYFGWWDIP